MSGSISYAVTGAGANDAPAAGPGQAGTLSIADYVNLITPQHINQPNFIASLIAIVQPMLDVQNTIFSLTTLFDLDSAIGVQLDQIGLWIGRDRRIAVALTGFFSWNTVGLGWNQSIWRGPFVPLTQSVMIDDDTYRNVLRAKVILNRWDGSMVMLYTALDALLVGFPDTTYVIVDHMDMTMTITFGGAQPSTAILTIVRSGILPFAPHGVTLTMADPW